MRTGSHLVLGAMVGAAVGAFAAVLPDIALLFFGWREAWLPESHWLVRTHRALHNPWSILAVLVMAATAGWASHVVADLFCSHRTGPR